MKPHNRLSNSEQTETQAGQKSETAAALQFESPDELLRHDALHTMVPPAVSERLRDSLRQTPPPAPPWWRRWLKS